MTTNPTQELVMRRCLSTAGDGGLSEDVSFLRRCGKRRSTSQAQAVVLVSTGSFCPPHVGHLKMLKAAMNALPPGKEVTGFLMIPSSEEYIARKHEEGRLSGGRAAIPSFAMRAQLLRTMATDLKIWTESRELHISQTEQSRGFFYMGNFGHLAQEAQKALPASEVPALVYVTGPDRKAPLKEMFEGCSGVVVIPREGEQVLPRTQWHQDLVQHPLCLVVSCSEQEVSFSVSSSHVRKCCLEELVNEQKLRLHRRRLKLGLALGLVLGLVLGFGLKRFRSAVSLGLGLELLRRRADAPLDQAEQRVRPFMTPASAKLYVNAVHSALKL